GLGRRLLRSDAEILHRVPAAAESHALRLQRLQRLLERGIHRALDERLQRRPEHHELEAFDVLPSADSSHVISDVPQDELGLIKARIVELVDDPVLPRVLLEVGCIGRNHRHQNNGDHETWKPAAPNAHSTSSSRVSTENTPRSVPRTRYLRGRPPSTVSPSYKQSFQGMRAGIARPSEPA